MTGLAHVSPSYVHYRKRAVPREALEVGASMLKLYHLEKPGEPVPDAVAAAARAALVGGVAAGLDGDRGFAIVHRCGADFHFLLTGAWRGSNELWEAVWYRDGGMAGFAPFDAAYPPHPGPVRPTFCVWELGIVAHESDAWARFLASPRGAEDLERWRSDWREGEV
ncbi:MAG TPA: hypothetical protein VJS15_09330 [Allosphingosinicella sp.]|nr:hypothetical protein [Allosphingosinicella sp.]